jgi:hypothetical protein
MTNTVITTANGARKEFLTNLINNLSIYDVYYNTLSFDVTNIDIRIICEYITNDIKTDGHKQKRFFAVIENILCSYIYDLDVIKSYANVLKDYPSIAKNILISSNGLSYVITKYLYEYGAMPRILKLSQRKMREHIDLLEAFLDYLTSEDLAFAVKMSGRFKGDSVAQILKDRFWYILSKEQQNKVDSVILAFALI